MGIKGKRFIAFLLVLFLGVGIFQTPINAGASEMVNAKAQPRYTYLQSLSVGFGVNPENGEACAFVITSYYSDVDYVVIRVDFERYNVDTSKWVTLSTALAHRYDNPTEFVPLLNVTPGYDYRAVVTVYLYVNGEVGETVRLPSVIDTY